MPTNTLVPVQNYIGAAAESPGTSGVLTADIIGTWINVAHLDEISFDMSWPATGTPIGTFYFRVSNAYAQPSGETAGQDSGFTGWANPSGAAGSNLVTIDLKQTRCKWIMLWYDRTSGGTAATLTVRLVGRGR